MAQSSARLSEIGLPLTRRTRNLLVDLDIEVEIDGRCAPCGTGQE
jgi:hypothetical protein